MVVCDVAEGKNSITNLEANVHLILLALFYSIIRFCMAIKANNPFINNMMMMEAPVTNCAHLELYRASIYKEIQEAELLARKTISTTKVCMP